MTESKIEVKVPVCDRCGGTVEVYLETTAGRLWHARCWEARNATDAIAEALTSDAWTTAEKTLIRWLARTATAYEEKIIEAALLADVHELERLALAYDDIVGAVYAFQRGELNDRLRRAGLPAMRAIGFGHAWGGIDAGGREPKEGGG